MGSFPFSAEFNPRTGRRNSAPPFRFSLLFYVEGRFSGRRMERVRKLPLLLPAQRAAGFSLFVSFFAGGETGFFFCTQPSHNEFFCAGAIGRLAFLFPLKSLLSFVPVVGLVQLGTHGLPEVGSLGRSRGRIPLFLPWRSRSPCPALLNL